MRGAKPELPAHLRARGKQFRIPQVPIEWLDASSWRLPSGKALAEFALQAGFLTPLLFKTETFARGTGHRSAVPVAPGREESPAAKHFEKEGNR
jgi:hypothetical protein